MAEATNLSLMEALSVVPDPRSRLGLRHALPAVLALLSMAVMCGCRSVYAALQWGRDQGAETVARLGLGKHGVPTDGMMSNLLRRLDVPAFEAALARWAAAWPEELGSAIAGMPEVVAIDGKTLRGSRGHEVPGVHLLSAYAVRLGVVLQQVPANAADGGEIQAAPALLEGLVLQGKVITGDAIHVQRELCQKILDAGGDYLLTVKENQPALHLELVDLFRSPRDPLLPTPR
jgi:DDE_Tnp_1-associated/Transposase DDE domain